jgi:hypothetical protein
MNMGVSNKLLWRIFDPPPTVDGTHGWGKYLREALKFILFT